MDVSIPSEPEEKGWYDNSKMNGYDVAIQGFNAFIIKEQGLSIIDMSDPAQLVEVALWQTGSFIPMQSKVKVSSQSYAYISDKKNFYILDISDISLPQTIGSYNFDEHQTGDEPWSKCNGNKRCWIHDVTVVGQYAILTIDYQFFDIIGLQIVDISDPQFPRQVGSYAIDDYEHGQNYSLAIFDSSIYFGYGSVLKIINFSDPASPYLAGQWQRELDIEDIKIRGTYAYLAGNTQIDILDLSDPENPEVVGSLTTAGDTSGLAVDDESIFVADGAVGFLIFEQPPVSFYPVYRFYNTDSYSHLFTIDETEKNTLTTENPQFLYEFTAFHAYKTQVEQAKPVYHFLNSESGAYFYTISDAEKLIIEKTIPSFSYQGIGYYAFEEETEDTVPLYRFYNQTRRYHFYTTSESEKNDIISSYEEYLYDGIAFYVLP